MEAPTLLVDLHWTTQALEVQFRGGYKCMYFGYIVGSADVLLDVFAFLVSPHDFLVLSSMHHLVK